MIVFVDGSTRVGKDFLIEQIMSSDYPELFGITESNYEFLKQFSDNGGTDGMFINTINIVSHYAKLITKLNSIDYHNYNNLGSPIVIINRSLLSDFTEYLMLALVNREFLDTKRKVVHEGSLLAFYDRLVRKHPQYLQSVMLTLSQLTLPYQSQIRYMMIEGPRYSYSQYLDNLKTDKAKYHYTAILNRMNVMNGVDHKLLDEFRLVYNYFMNYLIDSVNGERIRDSELLELVGK